MLSLKVAKSTGPAQTPHFTNAVHIRIAPVVALALEKTFIQLSFHPLAIEHYAVLLGNVKKTFITLRKVLNKATTTYFE